jgi:hypothetical protein
VGIHRSRIRTLQAVIAGVPCLNAHPKHAAIQQELADVHRVRRIRQAARRRLLEVLYGTRALDTTLAAFVGHHGCLPKPKGHKPASPPKSLGGYLYALEQHQVVGLSQLTKAQRHRFQTNIASTRNRYMHEAAAVPTSDIEVQVLLSEMEACLVAVSRL